MSTDYRSFMKFCKSLEGQTFQVANQSPFLLLTAEANNLAYFIPTTLAHYSTSGKVIKQMLSRYDLTGSLGVGQYADLDCASYAVPLLVLFVKQRRLA
jgi:hypothetical protein